MGRFRSRLLLGLSSERAGAEKLPRPLFCLLHLILLGMAMRFPEWSEAPQEILALDGYCGLLAAWSVLRYFRKRVSVPKLVKACRHTKLHGVFTLCLAVGLKEHGLCVSFHSDPDNGIAAFEGRCYARARRMGVNLEPALDLSALLGERRRGRIPIVFFNTSSDVGHFSPLLGVRNGVLRLPLAEGGAMRIDDFVARRYDPEILRQSIVVGR
jgi:hypothetical protein